MTNRLRYVSLFLLALTAVTSTASPGQQGIPVNRDPMLAAAPLPQDQLNALLAPIALYPDQLLAQVLMASTYPLDVVSAARFVQQNPSLQGDALDRALQDRNWDPSVLSLTAYPQVLLMMNDMLDWTQRLGEAFLANQKQVMDTVQMLRHRAQAAGTLQSTPQQTVLDQGGILDIEPAQTQYVYVPAYDPAVIYGSWPDPAYAPPYWYPPAIYGYPDLAPGFAVGIFFGTACRVYYNHWGWAHPNWHGHGIDVDVRNNHFADRPQYVDRWRNGRWAHSSQRDSIAYRDHSGQGLRTIDPANQPRERYGARNPLPIQQANARPVSQPPLSARSPQLQPPARFPPAAQATAYPLQQSQPRGGQPTLQRLNSIARPTPQPQWTAVRPLPHPQSTPGVTRAQPQLQSMARSSPPPRPSVNAIPQPRAPQLAYRQLPRAPIQLSAGPGQVGHVRMNPPSAPAHDQHAVASGVSRPRSRT